MTNQDNPYESRTVVSQLLLASLGAISMAGESARELSRRCLERGADLRERMQTRCEKRAGQRRERFWSKRLDLPSKAKSEHLESLVARLGVPTKSQLHSLEKQLDEIQKKLDQVSAKTETNPSASMTKASEE
jgi:polyhydroxyalkanoate synthesis regulator phasin